jgi:triosephosphate isomerase
MYGRLTSGLVLARDIAEMAQAARPLSFDLVLCPPATLSWAIGDALQGLPVMLGGQDCHTATHGAYTGDLSAAMFVDMGCRYMILGHSERRIGHGESNELIAKKVEAAQLAGLTTIVCVGETAADLQAGAATTIIEKQLRESLPNNAKTANLVIAYEPVWAIGTGQQPGPEEVVAVHKTIRKTLGEIGETVRIIYGGSVTPSNAGEFLREDEIDGVLVGSASLNADGFWAIADICQKA